jgi:outer membrane protein TolC
MKRIIQLFVLMLAATNLSAGDILTLAQSIEQALTHSPQLRVSEQQFAAGTAAAGQAKTGYYPYLSAALNHDQLIAGDVRYSQSSLNAVLDWKPGNWLYGSAESAQAEADALRSGQEVTRLQVIRQTVDLYLSVLDARIRAEQLESLDVLLQQQERISEQKWNAGLRSRLDVLQTQSLRNDVHQARQQVKTEMINLLTELAILTGNDPENPPQPMPLSSFRLAEDEGSATDLSANPQLQQIDRNIRAVLLRQKSIDAEQWPHVSVMSGYVRDGDPGGYGNYWHVAAGISIPLFEWNRTSLQRQEARAIAGGLTAEKDNLQRNLELRARHLLSNQEDLHSRYQLQSAQLELAHDALEVASVNYQAGLIENLTVLTAQQRYTESDLKLHQMKLQQIVQQAELFLLMNQPEKIAILQPHAN